MVPQLPAKISRTVRSCLEPLGRTEDVRFSPDNKTLAIAGYINGLCLLLRIKVRDPRSHPRIAIHDALTVVSSGISRAHGVDFLDDRTVVIGNRDGFLSVIELPGTPWAGRTCEVEPQMQISASIGAKVDSPGSVVVINDNSGNPVFLTCDNFAHSVSRHEIDRQIGYSLKTSRVLVSRGLDIPDGIAVSHDGQWLAVSSHNTHDVKLYEMALPNGEDTEPAGVLSNAGYPHGLRFTANGERIVVADAGDRIVRIYERGSTWHGEHLPERCVPVISVDAFERGRAHPEIGINPEEGGPKGIDIDNTESVLVTTCEEQPLAFFSLSQVLDRQPAPKRLGITIDRPWEILTKALGRLPRAT